MDNRTLMTLLFCTCLFALTSNAQSTDTLTRQFFVEIGPELLVDGDQGYALTYRMRETGTFHCGKKFNYHLFWSEGVVNDPRLNIDGLVIQKIELLSEKLKNKISLYEERGNSKCKEVSLYKLELSVVVLRSDANLLNYELKNKKCIPEISFFNSNKNYFIIDIL